MRQCLDQLQIEVKPLQKLLDNTCEFLDLALQLEQITQKIIDAASFALKHLKSKGIIM